MIWTILAIVSIAGAVGGFANALLSGSIELPWTENPTTEKPSGVWRPGFLGNVLLGGTAALLSFGTYTEAVRNYVLLGPGNDEPLRFTLGMLTGAFLVGTAGARWIGNEIDKKLLKEAASTAAARRPDAEAAAKMISATPERALTLARGLPPSA